MTRDLLLARRLIEAVVDPDASPVSAEEAGADLAEVSARIGIPPGQALRVESFEGMKAADLSPAAWLYLLESRGKNDPEIPGAILEALFLEFSDAAVRFRLVSGALSQPPTRKSYDVALERQSVTPSVESLPESWPRRRLEALQALAATPVGADSPEVQQGLQEFVLYLLQDGSDAALALAAAAVAPLDWWRTPARDLARGVVRAADPELSGFGRAFREAGI